MKQGRTLQSLAEEIERQNSTKRDFKADTRQIRMGVRNDKLTPNLSLQEKGDFEIGSTCHEQIASRLSIPQKYYDRMLTDSPSLLAENVNHWFDKEPDVRMLRTLDGKARAFLSDRYRALDNYDLANIALPIIAEHKAEIKSCEITEKRMYIKVVMAKIESEVKKGDIVQAGLVISNSETGQGSLRVEPLIYRLVCLNGLITDAAMRKYHIGKMNDSEGDGIEELLRDETKMATDKAFWMRIKDIIEGSIRRDVFEGNVTLLREAFENKITKDPIKVVEIVKKTFSLTEGQQGSILRHLIEGSDLSQYGLANAITRTSQDELDYNSATNLERLGGKVIELPKNEWETIALN